MSMHEALRGLRDKGLAWLTPENDTPVPPKPLTAAEQAELIVQLAKGQGTVDRTSSTWSAVARWAATELIAAHFALETADHERAAALRARCKALRDLLAIDERAEAQSLIEDPGPYVP